MIATIDLNTIESKMRSEAILRGVDVSNFATAAYSKLKAAEQQADGITNEEARDLLAVSALENTLPSIREWLTGKEGVVDGMFALLLVLAVAYSMMSKERRQDYMAAITAPTTRRPSLMDFMGVGHRLPGAISSDGTDVDAYIRQMRDEWDADDESVAPEREAAR